MSILVHFAQSMISSGCHFIPTNRNAILSLGLKNIESRLSMIDAEISYEPAPLKGTKVQIKTGYQNAIF